ncbi:MAG TPA: hypothetical protein VMX16_10295 [Terriglobia bacterium]|nr:hypothetical protein [Terriglobia bacterium]
MPNGTASPVIEKRLKWAAVLIVIGLIIQMFSFVKIHPLLFVAFLMIGCPFLAAGVLLYLYSLASHEPTRPASPTDS